MKRKAKAMLPTMKVETDKERDLDLDFVECQATIKNVEDIETKKYGTKTVATLESDAVNNGKEFNVFINNYSMQNLIEEFGDEDKAWIGKLVNVVKDHDENFDNDMIVLKPVA